MNKDDDGIRDERLDELGERYFSTQHTFDPLNATLLGLDEFEHLLPDPGPTAGSAASEAFAEIGRELEQVDLDALAPADQLDHAVLTALARGAEGDARHQLWAANASAKGYVSPQGLVFQAIPTMAVNEPDQRSAYLERLAGLGDLFAALGERYRTEAAAGRRSTVRGLRQAMTQLAGQLEAAVDESALFKPVRTATGTGAADLRQRAEQLIGSSVQPAIARLLDLQTELLADARPDDQVGIRFVPGGEEGYQAALDRNTTLRLDPEQIHSVGLAELAALEPRWREIGRSALGEGDRETISTRLRSEPGFRFGSGAEIVHAAQSALARAKAEQPRFFPDLPISDCVIEEIGPAEAEDAALAYYRPPAVDGSRPGAYCLLTTEPATRFRYESECLAFHESIPGHHLQLATAQLLEIPRYRRHLDVEACSFNEGWGLYCEQLADEIGLYSGDLDRLGMLSHASLRACRLVVDTGLHHYGWSREQAVDFMWQHTATTWANVVSEVDRYIAWPGQAVSYLVGKREILRLREQARAALGDRFDLRGFHTAVLGQGAVPLPVLGIQVNRWTEELAAGAAAAKR